MFGCEFTFMDCVALALIIAFAFCKAKYYLHKNRYIFLFLGIMMAVMSITGQIVIYYQLLPVNWWGNCHREVNGLQVIWTPNGYVISNTADEARNLEITVGQSQFKVTDLKPHGFIKISRDNRPYDGVDGIVRMKSDTDAVEFSFASCLCTKSALTSGEPRTMALK